jgi:hypothetical protein
MAKTVTKKGFIAFCNYLLPAVKDGYIGDKEWARAAMLAFGDLPSIPSGLVSKKLLWTHEPTGRTYRKSKVTHEHFKTRTKTCREIVGVYLREELTQEILNDIIEEGRKVHFVEEYENIVLRPYQQDESIEDWEIEYANAGIELVKDPGTFGHKLYYYEIDTIMYADKHEAAKKHKCNASTVVNRSRSVKWPTWSEFKYDFKSE